MPPGRRPRLWRRSTSRWLAAPTTAGSPAHIPFDDASSSAGRRRPPGLLDGGSRVMGYFTRADLPFHYALADAFTICDRYFCSVIGPTNPNRLYLMSATIDPEGHHGGPDVNNLKSVRHLVVLDHLPRAARRRPASTGTSTGSGTTTRRTCSTTSCSTPGSHVRAVPPAVGPMIPDGQLGQRATRRRRERQPAAGVVDRRAGAHDRAPRRPARRRGRLHRSRSSRRSPPTPRCGRRPRSSSPTTRTVGSSTTSPRRRPRRAHRASTSPPRGWPTRPKPPASPGRSASASVSRRWWSRRSAAAATCAATPSTTRRSCGSSRARFGVEVAEPHRVAREHLRRPRRRRSTSPAPPTSPCPDLPDTVELLGAAPSSSAPPCRSPWSPPSRSCPAKSAGTRPRPSAAAASPSPTRRTTPPPVGGAPAPGAARLPATGGGGRLPATAAALATAALAARLLGAPRPDGQDPGPHATTDATNS